MRNIGIIGSTGSIGTSGLDVISMFPEKFRVSYLSTCSNIGLLSEQIKNAHPKAVCVADVSKAKEFRKSLSGKKIRLYEGHDGLCGMVKDIKVDTLLVGIAGSSALLPVLSALGSIKRLALANKESLVMAGHIVIREARKNNVKILPVDSEHSAIFQCLASGSDLDIKKIYLTGSGGPLLNVQKKYFKNVTPEQAVKHPKWKMGKKISVDSATMMNKGLEVIEAHHLFGVDIENIQVMIHPEAIVHSMVEFIDGSVFAQMGMCDMRMPIQYALTYPSRIKSQVKGLDFYKLKTLRFDLPDFKKFPCLKIAYEAGKSGMAYPCVLNAANEIAVAKFLSRNIKFTDIPELIQKVLSKHKPVKNPCLETILEIDKWAKEKTKEMISAFDY